jgi:hypothetical protein
VTRPGTVEVLSEGLGPPPRTSRIGTGLVALGVAACCAGAVYWGRNHWQLGRVRVEEAWLSQSIQGEHLDHVRAGAGALYYHARLLDVPLGRRLPMECEWFDPAGTTVRHNHYETRSVDHDPWPTHCRCPLSGAQPGPWRVAMSVGGRALSETVFTVEAP